jgi:hypothetical protein
VFHNKIRLVGGGVQLGPLGTAATDWPIALSPGDYDGEFGGMKFGTGYRNTQKNLPQRHFVHHKSHLTRRWEAATNRLSYGVALQNKLVMVLVSGEGGPFCFIFPCI